MIRSSIIILLVLLSASTVGLSVYTSLNSPDHTTNITGEGNSFTLEDPIGDDNGGGPITYPTNSVFQPGVFDLTRFKVSYNDTTITFKVYLRNLGGNPWNGSNGFSLQYVQIYIRDPGWSGEYNTSSAGLNVEVKPGWSIVLLVNGGWGSDPLPEGEQPAIYDSAWNLLAVNNNGLYISANESENSITITVERSKLPLNTDPGSWYYLVALAGYDGYGPLRVRTVTVEGGEWNFGGGVDCAVKNGIQPYIIDLLSPNPADQPAMLNSFYCGGNRPATVSPLKPESKNTLYVLNDPLGDDKGPGNYTYPMNPVFQPGVFDIESVEFYTMNGYVYINVTMNNLGDNPWKAPNNYCIQYLQLYILPYNESTGTNTTLGINTLVYPGWKYLVVAGPGYNPPIIPNGQYSGVYIYSGNVITPIADQGDPSKIYTYTVNNTNSVIIRLDPNLIPGITDQNTRILLVVAGYDGYQPDKIRKINTTASEWTFGGASPTALRAGVEPRVIDALYPSPDTQYNFLSSYDPLQGRLAVMGMMYLNGTVIQPPAPGQPGKTTTTPPPTTTTPKPTTTTPTPTTTTPSTTTTPTTTTTTPTTTTGQAGGGKTTTPAGTTTTSTPGATTSKGTSTSPTTTTGGVVGYPPPKTTTGGSGGVSAVLIVSIAVSAALIIVAIVIIYTRRKTTL